VRRAALEHPTREREETAGRRRPAMALTVLGLCGCVAVAATAPHPRLLEPLTALLAATALVASLAYVDVEGTLLTDSSFVPFMLAAAFLGPTAVFGVAATSELATWSMYRYRREALLVNILATGGPLLVASGLFSLVSDRNGAVFYLLLASAGAVELVLNAFLVVWLIGMVDGRTVAESVRGWRKIVVPFLFNILLAVAGASVYINLGPLAVVVVLATIVSFRYLVAQVFSARDQAARIGRLAESRSRLVVETLDTEEREKRRLSEALHDGPLQDLLSAEQDLAEAQRGQADGIPRASAALEAAVRGIRGIVSELHPTVLRHGGLRAAVEALVSDQRSREGFSVSIRIDDAAIGLRDRLVFSILRELVRNAARHARATRVSLDVEAQAPELFVVVEDNGQGFDPASRTSAIQRGHVGLASIAERVEAIGGSLTVESEPGRGTRVMARIPSKP